MLQLLLGKSGTLGCQCRMVRGDAIAEDNMKVTLNIRVFGIQFDAEHELNVALDGSRFDLGQTGGRVVVG